MHRTHTVHRAAILVALGCHVLPACGKSARERPPSAEPATAAAAPNAGAVAAVAATPPPVAAPTGPVLDDPGLVGLTPAQMTSAVALQAAFPTAKVVTASRRYCPRGTVQASATDCRPDESAEGERAVAGPVRTYQVITVSGQVAHPAARPGKTDGSYLLQVIADGDRPLHISVDVDKLDAADLGPMPATLAAARRWRPRMACAWEGYPEASAHVLCTDTGGKVKVITQGPTPKIDEDSPSADAEWDLELAEFPGWLAKNGDDRVTSVMWGDEPGTQAW